MRPSPRPSGKRPRYFVVHYGPWGRTYYELKVLLEEVVERAPVCVVEAFFLVLRARDALRICRCSARPCVDHEESKKWRRLQNLKTKAEKKMCGGGGGVSCGEAVER